MQVGEAKQTSRVTLANAVAVAYSGVPEAVQVGHEVTRQVQRRPVYGVCGEDILSAHA